MAKTTPQPDTLVAYLYNPHMPIEPVFHTSLTRLLVRDKGRRVLDVAAGESGQLIAEGRNALGRAFLASSAKWMLLVDADMDLPSDVIDRLRRFASPTRVVGGLCFMLDRGVVRPVMFDFEAKLIEAWTPGSLVRVAMTGGACLMIHRSILERTPYPWFVLDEDGRDQDQNFCLNVQQIGVTVAVDTSTVVGHAKRPAWVITDADYTMPSKP